MQLSQLTGNQPKPGGQKGSQCWLRHLDSRSRNGSGEGLGRGRSMNRTLFSHSATSDLAPLCGHSMALTPRAASFFKNREKFSVSQFPARISVQLIDFYAIPDPLGTSHCSQGKVLLRSKPHAS